MGRSFKEDTCVALSIERVSKLIVTIQWNNPITGNVEKIGSINVQSLVHSQARHATHHECTKGSLNHMVNNMDLSLDMSTTGLMFGYITTTSENDNILLTKTLLTNYMGSIINKNDQCNSFNAWP